MGAKMTIEKRLAKLEARTRQRGTSHREELLERYMRGEVSPQMALHDLLDNGLAVKAGISCP